MFSVWKESVNEASAVPQMLLNTHYYHRSWLTLTETDELRIVGFHVFPLKALPMITGQGKVKTKRYSAQILLTDAQTVSIPQIFLFASDPRVSSKKGDLEKTLDGNGSAGG